MTRPLLLLLALAALLAAALAAVLFPAMHRLLAFIPFALVALLASGCTSGVAARLAKMPDGRFSSARLEEAGKFTATTIVLEGVTKDNGELSAEKITVDHSNPWVQKFHFSATDYQAQLTASTKRKPLPAPPAAQPVGNATILFGDTGIPTAKSTSPAGVVSAPAAAPAPAK